MEPGINLISFSDAGDTRANLLLIAENKNYIYMLLLFAILHSLRNPTIPGKKRSVPMVVYDLGYNPSSRLAR